MKIVRSQAYIKSLQETMQFISLDSKARALNFKHQLDTHIDDLDNMPFKFRKSIYFNDNNIRDLIFKGYIQLTIDEDSSVDEIKVHSNYLGSETNPIGIDLEINSAEIL